jgi:hypothetical protein
MELKENHRRALRYVAKNHVHVSNNGTSDSRAVSGPAVKELTRAGLLAKNGAAWRFVGGRRYRRLVVTQAGFDLLTSK